MKSRFWRLLIVLAAAHGLSACAALFDRKGFFATAETDPYAAEHAMAALTRGDYGKAEMFTEQALRQNPRDPFALLAAGLLFQNTNRPQQAKGAYTDLIALKGSTNAVAAQITYLAPRSIIEVAEFNLGVLEGRIKAAPVGAKEMNENTMGMGTAAPRMPAPEVAALAPPLPQAFGRINPPNRALFQEGDGNAVFRFVTLHRLLEERLITEDEFKQRRSANMAALLPLTMRSQSVGLDRPSPPSEQVVQRLQALARAFETRTITAGEHAIERGMILDGLLPGQPKQLANPLPPPGGMMELAATAGRLERLRQAGLITDAEMKAERAKLDQVAQMQAASSPMAKSAQPPAPESAAKPPVKMSGTTTGGSAAALGGKPGVHLASMKSQADAEKAWRELKAKYPSQLGKLSVQINRANVPGKGTYYRVQAGPLASQSAAEALCRALKSKRQYCDAVTLSGK